MSFTEIFEMLANEEGFWIGLGIFILSIIEVTPIKINPWSALFGWIGKKANKEVIDRLDKTDKRIDGVDGRIDGLDKRLDEHIVNSLETELKQRRMAILDFSSSLIRGMNYHKEKYDFMIAECDSYEKYCNENDIVNGVATASIAEIRRIYGERLRTGSFLTMWTGDPEQKVEEPVKKKRSVLGTRKKKVEKSSADADVK